MLFSYLTSEEILALSYTEGGSEEFGLTLCLKLKLRQSSYYCFFFTLTTRNEVDIFYLLNNNYSYTFTVKIKILYFFRYPSEQEFLLRSVPPLMHPKPKKMGNSYDPGCSSYDCPKPNQLPPLPVKPQV